MASRRVSGISVALHRATETPNVVASASLGHGRTSSNKPSAHNDGYAAVPGNAGDGLIGEEPAAAGAQVEQSCFKTYQNCCRSIVESNAMVTTTGLMTVYALVSSDCKTMFTNKPMDYYFDVTVVACLVTFFFEMVLSCFGKADYFLGFFFTLDVVSTFSLVLDISFMEAMMASSADSADLSSAKAGRTARIGARAARVVRVVRLFRIVKLYKAFMESSKKKKEEKPDLQGDDHDDWEALAQEGDEEQHDELERMGDDQESRVGSKLSEMTTKNVIILVLTMLLGLPSMSLDRSRMAAPSAHYGADHVWTTFFEYEEGANRSAYEMALLHYVYYHNWFAQHGHCTPGAHCADTFLSHCFWIGMESDKDSVTVERKAKKAQVRQQSMDSWETRLTANSKYIFNFVDIPEAARSLLVQPWDTVCDEEDGTYLQGTSLLQNPIEGLINFPVKCPQDLRPSETIKYLSNRMTKDQLADYHIVFFFDVRPYKRQESYLNLCETGFVCLILCICSMIMNNGINTLVLKPIEKMITLMKVIRQDPRMADKIIAEEFKAEQLEKSRWQKVLHRICGSWQKDFEQSTCFQMCQQEKEVPLETVVLEKTIMRLASLLTLGLGEAGLDIIGHSLSGSSGGGLIDVFALPERRLECIMAVVKTQDFSSAIEVLQAKVVNFIEHIVEIVHGVINEFYGAPNRNNGDTLLLVWRHIPDDHEDEASMAADLSRQADMALLSAAKILAAVQRSWQLAEYSLHPGFQQRLGSQYHVQLSFGIHKGWAIEGAIGSEIKIDCTYFSPHVNITFATESATSIYDVPIVATSAAVQCCSAEMRIKTRIIDNVVITGSTEPMFLYSVDLDRRQLKPEPRNQLPMKWNIRSRFIVRQWLDKEKERVITDDMPINHYWASDIDIAAMRKTYTDAFFRSYMMGYQNYRLGEWRVATERFRATLGMLGFEDGPSRALLSFMERFSTEKDEIAAPKSWPGYHKLDHHAYGHSAKH